MTLSVSSMDTFTLIAFVIGAISVYSASRISYLLYFHPLSNFPGPRLAAISNLWYAYHWLSGRWPWAIEKVLQDYGPVVRIAPNELAFFTPQAFTDIYSPHQKNLESFVKTDLQDRGKGLGGIVWEQDPVRHREVARKLSPAFSSRNIRSMEPIMHSYMDYFVSRMKELGQAHDAPGIPLVRWTNWLAMDMSADLAWNEEKNQMKHMKESTQLEVLLSFNSFSTILQVFKRFPSIRLLQYLFVPFRKLRLFAAVEREIRQSVLHRIEERGRTKHADFFDYILPAKEEVPTSEMELLHIGSVALQVMFAGWSPMADLFYGVFALLLDDPDSYAHLVHEIRTQFTRYDDITSGQLSSLPFLQACIEETLRLLPNNLTGLPRISPGAVVDGRYIAKGTHVQTCLWALARHPDYFHQALKFKPQRWLPSEHALYDTAFAQDHLKSLHPFSLGPRVCIGKGLAWTQGKLFVAKVLWTFDVDKVPGQNFDLEKTLLHYGFFEKPELFVKFKPVVKQEI